MSNSIIDQQRDNEDFKFRRSVYNGQVFMQSWLTGEMPPNFYKSLDDINLEINSRNLLKHQIAIETIKLQSYIKPTIANS